MPYHPNIPRLLTPGSTYRMAPGTVEYVIERRDLPDAVVPTGHVAVADPLGGASRRLPTPLEPGKYPLIAWVASRRRNGDEMDRRVAALQLLVHDAPVARWELTGAPESLADLGDTEYVGLTVDTGRVAVSDVTALDALSTWDERRTSQTFGVRPGRTDPVPGIVETVVDGTEGANVVAVGSGWGDGVYPVFACFDDTERFTGYVIDFMVVPEP
ncbi:uncharacterized protein DUF4241 [Stackebrandtia albiflava]|uniref:Uncharacterized protein DUF4241 n=1 Tax=Stackebrandtia albiflava TaxID=406432 RepID=A0A562VAV3_9ACTN|nr:DUF4241 domain-containing protein [Stackebrandtia albiflava]TWJ14971.1 uncharacterized protein DUF4241 [Stackebrandtia albiflava]